VFHFKNFSFLIIIILTITLFVLACSNADQKQSQFGVLEEASLIQNITRNTKQYNKSFDRTIPLPLKIWPSYTQKMLAVASSQKRDTCVLEGEPTNVSSMTEVEILEESTCLYTFLQEEGKVPAQYFVGLTKIKILETGQIGWIWEKAVVKNRYD